LVGHVYMEKWCENMVRSFRDEHWRRICRLGVNSTISSWDKNTYFRLDLSKGKNIPIDYPPPNPALCKVSAV
jgi:hypothetical protein